MTKTELRKKLEDIYLQGLVSGYLELSNGRHVFIKEGRPDSYAEAVSEAEIELEGEVLSSYDTYENKAFKAANKRWNKLKNSPLYKALS